MTSDSQRTSNKGHYTFRKINLDEYSKLRPTFLKQSLSPYLIKPEVYQNTVKNNQNFPRIHRVKIQNKDKDKLISSKLKLSSLKSRYSNPRPNRGKVSDSLHPITSTEFKEILLTRRHHLNSA